MTHKELMSEFDMLKGDINRMIVTKDPKELQKMYEVAEFRLMKIKKAKAIELSRNVVKEGDVE